MNDCLKDKKKITEYTYIGNGELVFICPHCKGHTHFKQKEAK